MAIILRLEVPGGTGAQYDRTNEILHMLSDEDAPDGLVSHVCGITDDGISIVDVWESEEAVNRFFEERLGAALHEAGVPPAHKEILQVHNIIPQGSGTDANVIMLIDLDVGSEVYDSLMSSMDAHLGDGEQHPCVSHVAGVRADGGLLIVDLWDSPEAFGEFAKAQIVPAAGDRLGDIDPRFVPVHNRIRGRATASV